MSKRNKLCRKNEISFSKHAWVCPLGTTIASIDTQSAAWWPSKPCANNIINTLFDHTQKLPQQIFKEKSLIVNFDTKFQLVKNQKMFLFPKRTEVLSDCPGIQKVRCWKISILPLHHRYVTVITPTPLPLGETTRVTTPTATESQLPWKRGEDEGADGGAVKQNEFPGWASNKEYIAYNSPSATFLGKRFTCLCICLVAQYLS